MSVNSTPSPSGLHFYDHDRGVWESTVYRLTRTFVPGLSFLLSVKFCSMTRIKAPGETTKALFPWSLTKHIHLRPRAAEAAQRKTGSFHHWSACRMNTG